MELKANINRFELYIENLITKQIETNSETIIQHNHVIGLNFTVPTCPYCCKFGNHLDKQTCKNK